jgi:hypothetical protein
MVEMTIWLAAAWAPGECGADVDDDVPVIEDCPFGLVGADEGGASLVPPHAISTAAESRSDEIRVAMRVMLLLPFGTAALLTSTYSTAYKPR